MTLVRSLKRINYRHMLPDVVIWVFALYASLYVRLGSDEIGPFLAPMHRYLALFLAIKVATFFSMGVYDIIWRYFSMNDALKLVRAMALSTVFIISATYLADMGHLPRSTFFIDALLSTFLLCGIRVGRRLVFERGSQTQLRGGGRLALIYGAGMNARTVASLFSADSRNRLTILGFIDDDPGKSGRFVAGVKVLGTRADLADLLAKYPVQELIIADPNLSGPHLREVVQLALSRQIRPRTLTDVSPKADERKTFEVLREVELSDLLNRSPNTVDFRSIRELIENKRVLVTGAGGSIGSEISRQLLGFRPSRLLLLDHSEYNLYQIDQELRVSSAGGGCVQPLLVDIKDRVLLGNVLREERPEIVFHAAAYKHVHLVESNPCSSILNNVMGTRNLLELSEEVGIEAFVQISTDKAVNPVGIMGATKRICELLVTEFARRTGRRYCSVRFGNVLGSSGSLVPLLQRQIRNGEAVTITHEGMTRYFMLIPEAVSLVLKAATIAEPGDIAILKMGEPVKIVDVARSLIALMGKTESECPIVFTGTRPGEKLFEELYLCGNELKTEHPDILILPRGDTAGSRIPEGQPLVDLVGQVVAQAQVGSPEAMTLLRALIQPASPTSRAEEMTGNVKVLRPTLTQ
jgi:FlaA1/EpsC-like NDP-sugar epimerase